MGAYKHLNISSNSDGSLSRFYPVSFTPPSGEHPTTDSSDPALSKDIVLHPKLKTWIRIFLPKQYYPFAKKLPVVIYFHAGGFILCSPDIDPIHNFTARMAADLPAIVISVGYRLAPEHRLPAAYDDAVDALLWVRDQALSAVEPWLKNYADFSRCSIMGSSSGGNIAYQLVLRSLSVDLKPLKLAGLILDQPFFGGEERTESEIRMADDRIVPLMVTDLMWELSLPVGADRDHEYSKPIPLNGEGKGFPRCLMRGYVGDPLIDRMRTLATMLEREGVSMVALLDQDGYHGVELYNQKKAEALTVEIRSFLYNQAY